MRQLIPQETLEVTIRHAVRSRGTARLWMALGFCGSLGLAVIVLAFLGAGERGTDNALLLTARLSFLLFWPAYSGSAMAALFGPPRHFFKNWARDFGLAFASAHLVHIGLVGWLCHINAASPLYSFAFFGIAVMWTYLLAVLSIDRLHQAVGRTCR